MNASSPSTYAARAWRHEAKRSEFGGELCQRDNAVTDIYMENVSEMLAECEARGRACLVGLQPSRALTADRLGLSRPEVIAQYRVRRLHDLLFAKVAGSPYRSYFVDLTVAFNSSDSLQYFTDTVHPDDRGQKLLADAMLPRTIEAVRATPARTVKPERCSRVRR